MTHSAAPTADQMKKCAAVHPADPRHQGDVGAHDRDEAADDQGLRAVLLEEVVGLVEVLLADDLPVVVAQRRTDRPPDLVAHDVARERRDEQGRDRDREGDVELAARDEDADREQQGVTREDREEQAALDEDDDQRDPEEGGAVGVEEVLGVHPVGPECVHHAVKGTGDRPGPPPTALRAWAGAPARRPLTRGHDTLTSGRSLSVS